MDTRNIMWMDHRNIMLNEKLFIGVHSVRFHLLLEQTKLIYGEIIRIVVASLVVGVRICRRKMKEISEVLDYPVTL